MGANTELTTDSGNRLNRKEYIGAWVRILHGLLGWSEQRTLIATTKFHGFLSDPDDMIYHRDPSYWLTGILIPTKLATTMPRRDWSLLYLKLQRLFWYKSDDDLDPDVDWAAYREPLNAILREYGADLSMVEPLDV
jgi:hypothetical protein